jgi:hypothetical protein
MGTSQALRAHRVIATDDDNSASVTTAAGSAPASSRLSSITATSTRIRHRDGDR